MAATDPVNSDPRRFSVRLPRPLWICLAAARLIVAAVGLIFVLPIYRQHVAIREIQQTSMPMGAKGVVFTRKRGPSWLRRWIARQKSGNPGLRYSRFGVRGTCAHAHESRDPGFHAGVNAIL